VTWTSPTPQPIDGPTVGADRPMLEAYLDGQRATLLNICAGLTADQLALRPLPSNLSLLGLVRHMAKVERTWYRLRAAREDVAPIFEPGSNTDFDDIDPADAPGAVERLAEECRLARESVAQLSLDDTTVEVRGETLSLRMIHLHMIGEYARHNGHADLLREAIDGVTDR
jgi:uncharacterized damage-inducible protein DinB